MGSVRDAANLSYTPAAPCTTAATSLSNLRRRVRRLAEENTIVNLYRSSLHIERNTILFSFYTHAEVITINFLLF